MRRSQLIALVFLLLPVACVAESHAEFQAPREDIASPRTAEALALVFDAREYELGPVRESGMTPRIYVHSIPLDMASISDVHEKKSLFIRTLLPLVLKANEEILEQRVRLLMLHGDDALDPEAHEWLAKRGADHVAELRSTIHSNALHEFDAAWLFPTGGSVVILPAP